MRRHAAGLILFSLFFALIFAAHAAEKAIGTSCSNDTNAADWDTIAQCTSGTFVRANPFVAQTLAIGSTAASATVDITGSVYTRSISGSTTTINWATGNSQYTSASCGAFSFSGMQDGGSYTLLVEGATSGTCSFSNSDSPSLTFKLPTNHGATTASTFTLYHFIRLGTYAIVTWMPGY